MTIYLRKVASEGINHHVEHCIFVPASRVLFSSRCPTFRVSLLSSYVVVPTNRSHHIFAVLPNCRLALGPERSLNKKDRWKQTTIFSVLLQVRFATEDEPSHPTSPSVRPGTWMDGGQSTLPSRQARRTKHKKTGSVAKGAGVRMGQI